MANEITLNDEAIKNRHVSSNAGIERAKLEQRELAVVTVPLSTFRVWDAIQTVLPGTPASDDLGITTGTLGTAAPYISTGDVKASTTTRYARFVVALPDDYEDGETVTLFANTGMVTTVSDTSATIDMQAYLIDDDGTVSADLVTTSAQSINSLTIAEKQFAVTPTALYAGALLDVRVAIAVTDGATATSVIGAIYRVGVLCDLR